MKRYFLSILLLALIVEPSYSQQNIGKIELDTQKGYYVVDYSYSDSSAILTGTIMPNNNVSPVLSATIVRTQLDTYTYLYEILNDSSALQPLFRFSIPISNVVDKIQSPNSDWFGRYSQRIMRASWSKVRSQIPGIPVGSSEKFFSYESRFPPSIKITFSENTYWSSFPNEEEGPFGTLDSIIDSLTTEGVAKMSLGPWLPDSTLSLKSFTDTLETFRFRSCEELGWANNATVCGQLVQQLAEVKTALQDQDSLGAANVLSEFIQLVEEEKETSLTSEGYALLFFNAQYLAERLPEPQVSSGITCECANLVTQTSGQIRFSGWETRCISGDFSGSVFFQQSGRLEVCGNATFQTISGNNPGTVAISETGVVSIQNWNNNNPTDSLVNWGTTQFQNQVNVNRGHLFNAGTLVVNGGLNQNNGSIENTGSFSVGRSVTLNQAGVRNAGNWSVGQRLTLNANAEMVNECQLMVEGTLMLNSTLTTRQESLVSVGGRMTINSQGLLSVQGTNTMVSVGSTRLNGAITSNGANQLLVSSGNVQFNNGAAINSVEDTLRVVAPNFADLSTTFTVADGTNTIIPISTCNSNGFNN